MKKLEFSLILPCYNEAEHFIQSSEMILETLSRSKIPFELIFVEDKSKDNTKKLIHNFVARHPKIPIQIIFHSHNLGRGQSVIDGILAAKAELVGYIDIDLEVAASYVPLCIATLQQGYDIVCGNRVYELSVIKFPRWLASKLYRVISRLLLQHPLKDTESGYKFFHKTKIIPLLSIACNKGWFWDTEIMVYSYYRGLTIKDVDVVFRRRSDKTSTVKLLPDTIEYIHNLIAMRSKLRHQIKNMRKNK